jgi:hypothetical protein
MYITFAIIYCQLWEFVLHFAQQPGALLQNCKYIQIGLGKLYNFDIGSILFAQKGNFTVFPISGSEFDHYPILLPIHLSLSYCTHKTLATFNLPYSSPLDTP